MPMRREIIFFEVGMRVVYDNGNSEYFGRKKVSNYEIKSKRYILKNYYNEGRFKLCSIKSL